MVESKTQKRKAAARTVAKAVHEAKKASSSESPITGRTRSKKGNTADSSKPLAASQQKSDAQELPAKPKSEEASTNKTGIAEDEFSTQEMVVRLTPEQETKLDQGLKKIKSGKKQIAAVKGKDEEKSSVVYIGRIPYGFFENQMRAYFSQFGEVLRLRISRNKKTARSKHYAFIEFAHSEVAEIVAETHNNMLMCERNIKCSVVPPSKVHPTMWHGSQRVLKPAQSKANARKAANGKKSPEQLKQRVDNLVKKEKAKRKRLEALGVEYDFPGYERLREANRPKRLKFS